MTGFKVEIRYPRVIMRLIREEMYLALKSSSSASSLMSPRIWRSVGFPVCGPCGLLNSVRQYVVSMEKGLVEGL